MGECLLSIAMIVKDEEHNIRRALESVKGVVDEIVVVDTGSKDRTPEIVREYTEKLFFHEWKDDFSEARNFSLKFPVCEWVLILDADEELSEGFRNKIRRFLKGLSKRINTVYVPTLSYLDWDFKVKEVASTPRIFRNGTVRYENIVHNQPVYKPEVVEFNEPIIHYGYIWTRSLRKKKYERTKNLILKHLKNAKDEDERIYYLVQLFKTESIGKNNPERMKIGMEILNILKKEGTRRLPGIVFEYMYMFGSICAQYEYYDLAEEVLSIAVNSVPEYPDPYFGFVLLYDRKKDYENIRMWSKRFLETMDKALKNIEKFRWTIMSMRYIQIAWFFKANAELRLGMIKDFKASVEKALRSNLVEDPSPIINEIFNFIREELDGETLRKIIDIIMKLCIYTQENKLNAPVDPVLEKIASEKIEISPDFIEHLDPLSLLGKLIKKRFLEKGDYVLEFLLRNSMGDFISEYNIPAVLFLFEILREQKKNEKEILKFLNKIKNTYNGKIRGIAKILMADTFLKMGNFKESLRYYRESLDELPELGKFIKEVLDDLKSNPSSDIEGVYEEILKFYSTYKEFIIDFKEIFPREILEKVYLISDTPVAKYFSAVTARDEKTSIRLLEDIPEEFRNVFPMYYHRLAQAYRKVDPEKAIELFQKSVFENEWLADILLRKFPFNGIYPATLNKDFINPSDEIAWLGNISEKFSTLGAIHPVKIWRKSKKGFLYSQPYPTDSALKLYIKRERDFMKEKIIFRTDVSELIPYIAKLKVRRLKIPFKGLLREIDEMKDQLAKAGVEIDERSETILVTKPEFLDDEQLGEELRKGESGILVLHVPLNDDSIIWYYPPFRVLRPLNYMMEFLERKNFKVLEIGKLGTESFTLVFSKK